MHKSLLHSLRFSSLLVQLSGCAEGAFLGLGGAKGDTTEETTDDADSEDTDDDDDDDAS